MRDERREDEPLLDGIALPRDAFDPDATRVVPDEALFERTVGAMRRRVATRRLAVAAGWLVAFGLGFGVARTPELGGAGGIGLDRRTVPGSTNDEPELAHGTARPSAADAASGAVPGDVSGDGRGAVDAIDLEARADGPALDPSERRDLLRRAGDAYLAARGDVGSAVRCYRRMLDLAVDDRIEVRADGRDSWLLIELKRDRFGI